MKKKGISRFGNLVLAIFLTLTCGAVLLDSNALEVLDDFGIKTEVTYSDAKDTAKIELDLEEVKEEFSIMEIIDPENEKMDFNNLTFDVQKNGEYIFKVKYLQKTRVLSENEPTTEGDDVTYSEAWILNGDEEEQTYDLKVKVDEIKTSEDTQTTIEENQGKKEIKEVGDALNVRGFSDKIEISPRSTATNNSVTIDIPDYNATTGWTRGDIKEVKVTVNFGDATSANKKVSITVPEGLRYEQISIKSDTNKTGADPKILTLYDAGDPIVTSATSITLPKLETVASKKSTFGKLEYQFLNTVQTVTIKFQVGVDITRYYGPHTVKNPISVDVRKGNNVLVGGSVVNQSVKLTGGVLSTGIITYYSTLTAAGSKEVIASTASDESLGRVNQYHLPLHNWEWKDTHRYAKSVTMDLYFPAGMEYHSITGLPAFTVVSKDNAAGRVTIKIDNWMTRQDFWLYYKVPIGKAVGTYNLTGKDKITYTWYDGTVESKTRPTSVVDYNTKVISTPVNKMTLSNSRDGYANADVEHYSRGTMWVFSNASAGKRTNQTVEFTIDPNWQAVMLHLPFDKTITTNKITKVYYKTNKSPTTWKEYNISTGLPLSGNVAVLKKTNMKNASGAALLASDEYFTAVKANIGSVSQDYTQSTNIDNNGNILVYGKFAPNSTVNEAPITISMYDESNKTATTVTGTRYVRKSLAGNKKVVSHSTVEFRDENNSIVSGITAGSSFKVNAKVSTRQVQQSTAQAMANPEIYLRQPKGMTIASDSITIKDNSGKAVAFDIAPLYQNKFGEKIYILKTKNCVLGLYLDENISINRTFNVSYTVGTDGTMAGGSMNARDLVSWGKDGYAPVSDGQTPGYVDAYDFNGNNNYTEQLLSFKDLPFTIAENKNVLVETFLSFAGQEPSAPYIEGVDSTLVYFTPGTQADYTVKMTNNSSSAAKTKVYIPIPKTNDNFGAGFQSTAFKWDMKLRSAVAAQSGFTVMYSTTATAANYEQAAQYKTAAQVNLADVKMVKIEATSMAVNATANFKIPLQINETFSSATQPGQEKVKTRNIYNPRYSVESASFNGNLPGTKVGAELIITEIGGTIFEDKNGNSIYDAGDLPVIGHSVELYKWDDVQKKYLVAKDKANKAITTVSNATGKYLFDNTLDLPKGTYAVKFAAKTNYQFVKTGSGSSDVDSNVIIADNLPKAGDKYKGWIIDIDGTLPIAKTMGCGFVKYNPATNLGLTLPTTTLEFKVDETRTMSPTSITPNYWETIKGNPGYKWELVTATDSQYVQLTAANQKQLTLKGLKKTPLGYEIQVKLTINDIYGGTKSATTKIKINTKVAPTITTSTINAYVGDQVNLLAGVSAKDDNNENIVITEEGALKNTTILNKDKISSSGGKYNKSETYKITYEVLDKYGNKGTKDRIIKVNGNPIITANAQVYQLGEADILTKVKNAAEASFMKASETPGNAATKTVFAMNAPTITGPTQDFTAVGKYQVTYSAKNEDNKSVSKTVDVIITNGIVPGNEQKGIEIRADNIVIERNELATFDLAKAMNKANVQAIYYERDDKKNLTKLDDITTSISVSSLDNIKKAPEKGGEYELTFTTTYSGVTSNKKILAVVVGNELKVQNGLVIKATDIDIENDAARVLTQSQAISLANVEAYVLQTKQATANNTVNTTQLNAIKAVTNDAQTFKLTYTATQDGKTVSIEKDVNVNHSLVGPVITADACEHYVGDKFEVLHDVSAKDVNNDAINLEMTGSNKNTEVEHQIPLENGEYKTAGTYEIKYAITDKYGNTTEKTRLVKVHAMPVIETNPQVYSLKDEDIAGQITAAASAYYNKADNAVGATPIKTKIDEISYEISGPSQDFSEVGTYEITYKSENVDGRKASKKVEVIITKNEPLPTDVD
ncbi:hypothetical protein M2475_002109, partial [Breznakia sp. PF5-3]|uniref:SdrD B-like domain-containing protein n=1 Tax=unclassified Breznakia TaxID=2623764 RepID=UPI002405A63E